MNNTSVVLAPGSASNSTGALTQTWVIYLETVLLAITSIFGVVGNVLVVRNALVNMTRSARQNVILFISSALGDVIISVLRGGVIIYLLFQADDEENDVICLIWMISTMFVAVTLMTNTVLAIQRFLIIYSYSKYKRVCTLRLTLITVVMTWILFPTACGVSFELLRQDSFFKISYHTCVLMYNTATFDPDYFTLTRTLLVCLFGYVPMSVTSFCYYIIYIMMKRSGLKKKRALRNPNISRVTILSVIRVVLMVLLLTPFFLMIILAPVYPGTLLPYARYADYLLVLYAAISPIVTLNDSDFKEYGSRRAWFSAYFGVTNHGTVLNKGAEDKQENVFSVGITPADLKCYRLTE